MYLSAATVIALCAAHAAAHGVVTRIHGANGVTMAGLSVRDGVPRDSPSPLSGAEDDTSVIDAVSQFPTGLGSGGPLGSDNDGPITPDRVINQFMGGSGGGNATKRQLSGLLSSLGGGAGGNALSGAGDNSFDPFGSTGGEGDGKPTPAGTSENILAQTAGDGAKHGLPTCDDNGNIRMTFHQVNQDGAGVLQADVDGTSGGSSNSAFKTAKVTKNVPGDEFGLSGTQTTDFPINVKMPAGMTCNGEAGGQKNVCIVRVHNNAAAGPFGGSAVFQQSSKARKRAIAFNLKNKRFARGVTLDEE